MLEIPITFTPSEPALPIDAVYSLDGRSFRLFIAWNNRAQRYYMNVYDGSSDEILVAGIALVARWSLLERFSNPLLPDGDLILIPEDESLMEPTLGDVGLEGNFRLIYVTGDELEALR